MAANLLSRNMVRHAQIPRRLGLACGEGKGVETCLENSVIAVVDDDDSFRLALAELLCSLGYGAREFASAEEFIAGDDEEACDCVITDVRMPGMSGLELGHLIASRQSPVPVIMVTAV